MSTNLCLHFGVCGGCSYQDLPDEQYRALKRDIVLRALARQGLDKVAVKDIIVVPPFSRRRCVVKMSKRDGAVAIGFHARGTHNIIDMRDCRVLTPGLFALIGKFRDLINGILNDGENAELHLTEADNGFDLGLRWQRKVSTGLIAAFAPWAIRNNIARITSGNDILVELAVPVMRVAGAEVRLPIGAFLQPTRAGEEYLQSQVCAALNGAKHVADLFAGCGTFSLALARQAKVHGVELDPKMRDALADAARATPGLKPMTSEKRDLFKVPLTERELAAFDGIALDPPRAGAAAQIRELAKAQTRRIAYVSCDAESFARDAKVLVDAGYKMGPVVPVDQFLWSEHIELVGSFQRG